MKDEEIEDEYKSDGNDGCAGVLVGVLLGSIMWIVLILIWRAIF